MTGKGLHVSVENATAGLTMNATPGGRSSCSEGRKAGPFLRRELLLFAAMVEEAGKALVPAAEVTEGEAISS